DLVGTETGNLDLGNTELVAARTDDVHRAIHRLGGDLLDLRGRPALQGQLDATLKVETQLRRLLDHDDRRDDHQSEHEQQHEYVAAPASHRARSLPFWRQDDHQATVVV